MGRFFLLSLGLQLGLHGMVQAQIAQSQPIVGPDGRGPAPRAPRPSQPTLEEQLRRRKKQEQETPRSWPNAEQPATPTDELLDPKEKAQIEAHQDTNEADDPAPRFRIHLGMAPARGNDGWRFEPGVISETAMRLTDPARDFTFWSGLRLAAWSGTKRSDSSFSRFSVLYAGPLFAFEWKKPLRQTLSFGFAGVNRQADPEFPGETPTRRFGFDGPGLWLSHGLGFRINKGFEWEARLGVQSSSGYRLYYLSLGVSLWSE